MNKDIVSYEVMMLGNLKVIYPRVFWLVLFYLLDFVPEYVGTGKELEDFNLL